MRTMMVALVAVLAACSNGGGMLSVSTQVARAGGAVASPGGVSAALTVDDHVTLERARILIRKVELEAESSEGTGSGDDSGAQSGSSSLALAGVAKVSDSSGDDASDDLDEAEVRFGPFLVDLSGAELDGGLRLLFDEPVPAGTYEEIMLQIHKLTPGEAVDDPAFAPLGSSVILDLTVDGEPVTFTASLTAVAEVAGPFTVDDGGTLSVTVDVDPSGWFTARDGSFLDPRVEANRKAIEQNVRASIRGFRDDDHDGQPDDAT